MKRARILAWKRMPNPGSTHIQVRPADTGVSLAARRYSAQGQAAHIHHEARRRPFETILWH
jgi:hypothetical protein